MRTLFNSTFYLLTKTPTYYDCKNDVMSETIQLFQ